MQEKWIRIFIPKECDNKKLKSWVKENISGRHHFKPGGGQAWLVDGSPTAGWYGQCSIKFEDPADAVAFKLMWL